RSRFLRAFQNVTQPWPQSILFGRAGSIILRGRGRGEPRQRFAVVPGHPLRRVSLQLLGVPLQLCQIVERIGPVQLTSMDQAHEQIADSGAVQRLIEECVFSIQDGFLQRALDDVMPTPGLCRVGQPAYPIREGSLILVAALVGIITSSPGKPARRPEAGSGQARGWMGWRAPVLV